MEIVLYITIFIIGTLFGSFYTLATYRIPKGEDITHTRSYCPNCNHKLGFFDMFPIFSYLFLGGKCRYCKQRISVRYILFEIMSGLTFLTMFYLMDINVYTITIFQFLKYIFFMLYITFIFLIAGIDKENHKIEKSVSIFGIIISLMYIAYLYIVENANIYRYAIYIVFYIIILLLDTISLKKIAKSMYIHGIALTLITITIFTGEIISLITVALAIIMAVLFVVCKKIITKIKVKKNENIKTDKKIISNINFAFFMGVSNIIAFIAFNIILRFNILQ